MCIIGSGAGGGMAAKVLTEGGADVVMLEAGPMWDPVKDAYMFKWPYDSPRRGAPTPKQEFGEFDACFGGFTLEGEPYTRAAGTTFDWYRGRMLGGRTNHWGRISLRYGPDDFRRRSLDGLGDDWPITYDELKPYYDQVDRFIGIFGTNFAASEGLPNEPDGIFMPPPEPRCYELLIKQAADKLGVTCVPSRMSIITQAAQRPDRVPLLRPVQPRLFDALELLVAVGADPAGSGDQAPDDPDRRDGARGHDRRGRPGDRRHLHRQEDRPRESRARAGGRARGERLRIGAHPAQLAVDALPATASAIPPAMSAST